jgi:hypothetical protein
MFHDLLPQVQIVIPCSIPQRIGIKLAKNLVKILLKGEQPVVALLAYEISEKFSLP